MAKSRPALDPRQEQCDRVVRELLAEIDGAEERVHAMGVRQLSDEEVWVAILAVTGKEGVFPGYGTTPAQAKADAWRYYRDRAGRGMLP